MKPTVGSLFSGIGGLDLGLERAGWSVKWQSEIDPYCSRVLTKHWPDVPNLGDVTKVDWSDVEPVDLICGGYPCQPFSLAGARRGTDDDRHLWPHMRDAIGVLRPRLALLENVPGHLSMGFGDVLGDLADLGYDAEWDCVPAAAVGAPHLRYRVFVVAYAQEQPSVDVCRESRNSGQANGEVRPRPVLESRRPGDVAYAQRSGSQGHGAERELGSRSGEVEAGGRRDDPSLADADRTARDAARSSSEAVFGPEAVERLGRCRRGLGEQWATEPDVGRVAHGVPSRVDRLRALGNAVVPQVAEFIGARLLEVA